jgi:phosphotransferase system  glucose/maltose/N-acetylglucosamine-specific IIC component
MAGDMGSTVTGGRQSDSEKRVPLGQVIFDDLFLLFVIGVVITLVTYTIWGLIDLASVPFGS